MQLFISKLVQSGLNAIEASLYTFIYQNPGISVAQACLKLKQSKSALYRAFNGLRDKNLIEYSKEEWKQSLKVSSLESLIQKLETRRKNDLDLIEYFSFIQTDHSLDLKNKKITLKFLDEHEGVGKLTPPL